ncbi:unnamed protein product, partial [Rotaria socialis]
GESGLAGSWSYELNHPTVVMFDQFDNMFILDTGNKRIQKWTPEATYGITIAELSSVNDPRGMSIDTYGNLVVVDYSNNQVPYWDPLNEVIRYKYPANHQVILLPINCPPTTATTALPTIERANQTCPFTQWNNIYSTIAGTPGSYGTSTLHLRNPQDVFVNDYDNVYVADTNNHRIIRFSPGKVLVFENKRVYYYVEGSKSGTNIAGIQLRAGKGKSELNTPTTVFVTGDQTLFILDAGNFRVQKWKSGEPLGFPVAGGHGVGNTLDKISHSYGLYVDDQHNVYVSDHRNHRVTLWMKNNTAVGQVVAGGNGMGNASNQLSYPWGVYVTENGTIYVADSNNHRIQKFTRSSTSGLTVAGISGVAGSLPSQLRNPTSILVDQYHTLFVLDRGNHRIMKWPLGSAFGYIVVPISSINSASSMRFDPTGNLIIADTNYHRIISLSIGCRCTYPTITLIPGPATLDAPFQVRRSQGFYISAYIERFCEVPLREDAKWTITNCTVGCSSSIPLHESIVNTSNELYVPARTLEYGIYEFKLTITMIEFPMLPKSEASYIKVTPSGITANLVPLGTTMITHGHQQNLTLNPGEYSVDPDTRKFDATQWNYTYSYRIYGLPGTNRTWIPIGNEEVTLANNSCFYNQSDNIKPCQYSVNKLRSSVTILENTLKVNQTYQFMVQMDNLNNATVRATGYVLVHVQNTRPPMVAIGCIISTMCSHNLEFQYINPSTQVALFSFSVDKSVSPTNITWNVYYGLMNSSSDTHNWTLFTNMIKYRNIWFFGAYTTNFTASNQLFQENRNIAFWRFEVVYTIGQEKSLSALNFEINQPPTPGICSIAPSNGKTTTKFNISCGGWNDTDGIKDYSFYAWTKNPDHRLMLGTSLMMRFELRLPAGDGNSSLVVVIMQARDHLNSVTEVNIGNVSVVADTDVINSFVEAIKITSKSNSTMSDKNPLVQLLNNNNSYVTAQVVTTVSQVFNEMNIKSIELAVKMGIPLANIGVSLLGIRKVDMRSESSSNASFYQTMKQELNDHASAREYLMKTMNSSATITSSNILLLQSSSLAQLTQVTNQLTRSTCILASNKCQAISLALQNITAQISFEDTQIIANHIIQCATNVLSAISMPLHQRAMVLDLDLDATKTSINKDVTDSESNYTNPNLLNDTDKSLHQRNLDEQNLITKIIANQVNETMTTITAALKVHLNVGQNMTVNTTAVFVSWEMGLKTFLINKTIHPFDHAQIRLPSTLNSNLSDNDVFSLRSVVQPLALPSRTHSQVNTSMSAMVSFSVLNSNGTEIPIHTDEEHAIEIIIPRDPYFVMPPMTLYNVTSLRDSKQQFYFHLINITQLNENLTVSLHVEMRPSNQKLSYLLIFKFDSEPPLNIEINDIDGWYLLCSSNIASDGIHTYFINNNRTAGRQSIVFGFRELSSNELCSYDLLTPPISDKPFHFSSDYELRTFTSACYYLDSNNDWQSDGLLVGPMTNHYQTQCFTTHLTTFFSAYSNAPSTVTENAMLPVNDQINVGMNFSSSFHSCHDDDDDNNNTHISAIQRSIVNIKPEISSRKSFYFLRQTEKQFHRTQSMSANQNVSVQ